MNRFSKDIDTIDNKLAGSTSFTCPGRVIDFRFFADSFRTFLNTASSITGAVILISILFPWFLIAVGIVFVLYAMAAAFYRASATETKVRASRILANLFTEGDSQRLDAILRSSLYSHFSESLSGIATIRAYREEGRFLKENRDWVDIENRAYWLTVSNQVCGFPLLTKAVQAFD